MNRFTVVWRDEALHELADIWLQSKDRKRVAVAVANIDSLLSHRPSIQGAEIHEGLRKLTVSPVCALFEVLEPDRLVRVVKLKVAE